MMTSDNWKVPYTIETRGILFFKSYRVIFEESLIFEHTSRTFVDRVAAALNSAYNLGASRVLLEQSAEKNDKR